jgi:hypothetical protein
MQDTVRMALKRMRIYEDKYEVKELIKGSDSDSHILRQMFFPMKVTQKKKEG